MKLWQDIRYATRTLRNSPGFTIAAIVTLGLGIGATTAIFSVTDAMLWKPLKIPNLDRLVMVLRSVPGDPNQWGELAPQDAADLESQQKVFSAMTAWEDSGFSKLVGSDGEPERISEFQVKPNFFDVTGVHMALGRGFAPGEDRDGQNREVVLSDALWQRRFGADPHIVGKTIQLDDSDYTVIGVAPHKFEFPMTSELWTPLVMSPKERQSRDDLELVTMGLLKPGRTALEARAETNTIAERLAHDYPETNHNRRFQAMEAHEFLIGSYTRQYVLMIGASVLFVLLIACVNVANLQFARALGRTREVAVRTSLGAGRWQLVSQFTTESMLLSLGGALLGLALASWGIVATVAAMPAAVARFIPGWSEIGMDGRTLAFTTLAAVACGVLSGLAPAWQFSRPDLSAALKEGGRSSSAGRGSRRLRAWLVAGEVALCVVLLVGASLMTRGLNAMAAGSRVYEPSSLLTMRLSITDKRYPQPHHVRAFYQQVLERLAAVPGAKAAVAVTALPYTGHMDGRPFLIEGKQPEPGNHPGGQYQVVSPNFFATLHVPLREGRLLTAADGPDNLPVAVLSQQAVRKWWPGEPSPLGKRIQIESDGPPVWTTIVGVVGDVTQDPWDREPRTVVYVPDTQAPMRTMDIAVRTAGDPDRLASAAIAAIRSVDHDEPVSNVYSLDEAVKHQTMGITYVAVDMGIFGLIALVLSSIGVYGVMAYVVAQQKHEIGIRMALGAPRATVMGMIFRRGMLTAGIGLAVGLVMAFGLARLMASLIFGVSATDPLTFLGIPLALAASVALAIYIPALRAMRIDPIVALRYE